MFLVAYKKFNTTSYISFSKYKIFFIIDWFFWFYFNFDKIKTKKDLFLNSPKYAIVDVWNMGAAQVHKKELSIFQHNKNPN